MQQFSWGRAIQAALLATALMVAAGCRKQEAASSAPRTDAQITTDIQARISRESALSGQGIQISVANGVATLTGNTSDAASRSLAGNDAGTVPGVKTVINDLTVQPVPQVAAASPAPSTQAVNQATPPARERDRKRHHAEPQQQPPPEPQALPESEAAAPPPPSTTDEAAAPAPPPPPAEPAPPVEKTVTISAGTIVPVRITEALDSSVTRDNDIFHGSLAGDLIADGMVAVPQGAAVVGRVVDARDAAHFKGTSLLSVELTQVKVRGRDIPVVTDAFSKEGAARGKNTAVKAGGGAALGALIGAIAGGGKGAAIGAVAGGGAGTAVNGVTRGQQVSIPSESLVNFRLQTTITVTTSRVVGAPGKVEGSNPQLQPR